jgi:ferrous iron transport protein B
MTVMMSPFMSCGARLSVYALFAAAFFKHHGGTAVMALYLIGIAAALLTALLLKHTLLPGRPAAFIMELPNYHMPSIHSVLIHAWHRLKGFLFDAGKIIIIMVMIINVANTIGTDGSFGNEDSENSVLSVAAKAVTPLFAPLGISEDNWPATVGIFTGVLAKEVVVGTLDTIYADLDKAGTTTEATSEPASIGKQLLGAAQTIPDNLGDAFRNLADPLGLRIIAESGDENVAAASQSVQQSTFGAMVKLFDGEAGAFAYLLFVLLYFPCASAFATIYRETSAPWAVFIGAWSLTLGFSLATLFYQTVTYRQHPGTSLAWILGLSTVYLFIIFLLRLVSKDERKIFRQQAQT